MVSPITYLFLENIEFQIYLIFFHRKTYVDDILVRPGPCNLPIIDGQVFTNQQFLKEFAYEKPFVLRDATDNKVSTQLLIEYLLMLSQYLIRSFLVRQNYHSYSFCSFSELCADESKSLETGATQL